MKLVVLGATGGIGLEIVRQAIEHEHSVSLHPTGDATPGRRAARRLNAG